MELEDYNHILSKVYSNSRPLYTKYAHLYDSIVKKPVIDNVKSIRKLFHKYNVESHASILDVGCGTGRYGVEFARLGYNVTGIDLSHEQIETAKSLITQEDNLSFLAVDMFEYNPQSKFDVIFCRGVLNDILTDELRIKIFQKFSSLLKNNGYLLFDVRNWEQSKTQVEKNPLTKRVVKTDDGYIVFLSSKVLDEEKNQYYIKEEFKVFDDADMLIDSDSYDLIMRCWTNDEIVKILDRNGLTVIEKFPDFDMSKKTEDSVYTIIFAQKKQSVET